MDLLFETPAARIRRYNCVGVLITACSIRAGHLRYYWVEFGAMLGCVLESYRMTVNFLKYVVHFAYPLQYVEFLFLFFRCT